MPPVPPLRVRALSDEPLRGDGTYVLYWMVAARRVRSSFALQHAIERAGALGKPLVVLEALRLGYPHASDRLHTAVLGGMADNLRALDRSPVTYLPYVERRPGEGRGLLEALARRACLVISDEFPAFFIPHMQAAAAARLGVRLELVDGNGLMPLRLAGQSFATAYLLRRFLQKHLHHLVSELPVEAPLEDLALPRLPAAALPDLTRWPLARADALDAPATLVASLGLDHGVPAVVAHPGGSRAAHARLRRFVDGGLARYAEDRNVPDLDATSRLSPDLHFGHLGVHEVLRALWRAEAWTPDRLGSKATGSKQGFWGLGASAEAFVDELVTWRELGFNNCAQRADADRFEALPEWAIRTLLDHADDPRPHRYSLDALEAAQTHDPLWNAAQRQLVREGRIHGYLRMLWGKKILEWSSTPLDALAALYHLNDRHALDGRDPNSVSGILWTLGRHDRPWGPERPIFGKVRYMSSENTARKVAVRAYLQRYT